MENIEGNWTEKIRKLLVFLQVVFCGFDISLDGFLHFSCDVTDSRLVDECIACKATASYSKVLDLHCVGKLDRT